MSTVEWLAIAAAAVVLGMLLTRVVLHWADGRIVDHPNERSSHVRPTPRGGGLAIVMVALGGTALYSALVGDWRATGPFLAGGLLVALISLIDDIRSTSSALRFAVHAIAAVIAIGGLTGWDPFRLPLGAVAPWLGVLLALLWVVGLTNAYNFMDGIDGIAGTQGVVAGVAWTASGIIVGSPATTLIGLLLAGACVGFLRYNWPPARIFMGDVGSAFLGFSFGVLPLVSGADRPGMAIAASLVCAPFLFDTVVTFIRRLRNGENVLQAHRSHIYQRLATRHRAHGWVTLLYGALATVSSAVAVAALLVPHLAVILWFAAAGVVGLTLRAAVAAHERADRGRVLSAEDGR